MPTLDTDTIREKLSQMPDWSLSEDGAAITRTFTFRNFSEAFAFMTRTALAAEKLDHHPDWKNTYKTVEVSLSTHDAGGLTESDFKLASRMETYARAFAGTGSGH